LAPYLFKGSGSVKFKIISLSSGIILKMFSGSFLLVLSWEKDYIC
jgi:hypothetical protein